MEKKSEKKQISNRKKTIIQYSLIVLAATVLGITGGAVIKKTFGQVEVDYSDFDANNYSLDPSELLKEYEKNPNKEFTPAELVNIGLEKYRRCENSYSIGVGTASTIVNQTIRNAQIKNGDKYFEESISRSSVVSLANRVTQTGVGQSINLYKGKADDSESGKYKDEPVTYEPDKYKEECGKTLDEMFIYIISNQSVIAENCSITKTTEIIKVELELDVNIATYYYKKQMKSISNLSGLPTFDSLKHTYIFSTDMTLLHSKVDEKYKAAMTGISASIHNTINYYYHANEYLEIPSLDQAINYSIEGEVKYE